jgi:hypothetical protein
MAQATADKASRAERAKSSELTGKWEAAVDANGKRYYWNCHTRETRWDEPEILARQQARLEGMRQRQAAAAEREAQTREVDVDEVEALVARWRGGAGQCRTHACTDVDES